MPRGTLDFLEEPIRDETPEAYEALRKLTDVPFAIGEEFASQVAVPALHRAGHPPVQPHRRLQCRRPDRGDEGRRLERGALRRHDAAQPARPDLHRRHGAFRRRRRRISPGSRPAPRRASSITASTTPSSSRTARRSKAPSTASATSPGLGVEVDEALVAKQSYRHWEAPHLVRRDGSVTNW